MAARPYSIIPGGLWPGLWVSGCLFAGICLILTTLGSSAIEGQKTLFWQDPYLRHLIAFSFWQALLSTLLSILPAIPLARALYRRRFPGRSLLLRLLGMTLILPVLVAVSGILSVYGREGLLAQICVWFGVNGAFSPYGLKGILLIHVFFNFPFATRLLLQILENIPGEQRQIAAQLGMKGNYFFRLVEWPWIKRQILPISALIFTLCFSSFSAVLLLGGGPQFSTLEVAIFQALTYDYDPARAAYLALLQMGFCLGLILLSQHLSKSIPVGTTRFRHYFYSPSDKISAFLDILIISFSLLLLIPPLLAIIIDGLHPNALTVLFTAELWQATFTSLYIAFFSGLFSVILTFMLLWTSREFYFRKQKKTGQIIELSGMLILSMPGIVLASGLFLLSQRISFFSISPAIMLIIANALMALPYAIRALSAPMQDIAQRYHYLCASLGIQGWRRIKIIEIKALRFPLAQAMAYACILSMGDFGIIALFGNDDFFTLPFWLYQQRGAYHDAEASVTALVLFMLCFILFTLIEKQGKPSDQSQ